MKTATHSITNSRLVLILIGVVIALISLVALGLEWRTTSWPLLSGSQISANWFNTVASQTIQWVYAVVISLF